MIKFKFTKEDPKGIKLSSPWVQYYHDLNELFGSDPNIKIEFFEDIPKIRMYVNGGDKYEALSALIPVEKTYGNVVLSIDVIPDNSVKTAAQMLEHAFEGNPNYSYTQVIQSASMSDPMTFVVFKKKVAQFFNDNLSDPHGNKSTLYEDLARDVLVNQGVFYCTDNE